MYKYRCDVNVLLDYQYGTSLVCGDRKLIFLILGDQSALLYETPVVDKRTFLSCRARTQTLAACNIVYRILYNTRVLYVVRKLCKLKSHQSLGI